MKFLSSNCFKHLLLIMIMFFSTADSVIAVSQTERESLIALYHSTDGTNWEDNTNWLGGPGTECTWFGITCESGNVIRINLSNNKLSGTIPAEIGQLTLLYDLFLNENQLTGHIPAELGQLSKLQYLFLENNILTGNIPAELGHLSDLISLWLQNNQLTGSIPTELGQLSNLISLVLSNNQLSGRIPAELAQLSFLIDLNLFNNQLTGTIPYSIIHLTNLINDSTEDGLDLRTDFRNNALHTSDSDILSFLSQKQYATYWQSSQNILNVCQTCPHTSIQSAINAASHTATTIVVHDGTYVENIEFPEKNIALISVNGPEKTIINGNNSDSVVTINTGTSHSAILEGFTIMNGSSSNGGGINISDSNMLVVSRCIIKNNNADIRGGGIYAGSSTAKIENCIVTNNSATEGHGIYTYKTICELLNSTITKNSFPAGEGFKGYRSTATIKNVIFWHNGDEIILENNTNANVEYSNIEGGYEGKSNIDLDPLFVDIENENFHIHINSPCKDRGTLLDGIYNDIDNQLRPKDNGYDIGADEVKEHTGLALSLIALYNSTDGENWNNNTNWLGESGTECTWYGVNCEDGSVVRINLSDNQLKGRIPVELGQLSSLQSLILSNNQLTGSLPAELGQLSNLQSLVLSRNQLSGNIPAELSQLSKLQSLLLNFNQLSGNIPSELSQLSNLQYLYLYDNELTGSIPSQLGQLSILQDLNLSSNKLSGSIPSEIGQLTNLQNCNLSSNELNGNIPKELGLLTNLKYLVLDSNMLTEGIPSELGQLSSLQNLSLSSNQLTGNIPTELGLLSNLRQLLINDNLLTGVIPNEIGHLSYLQSIYLDRNTLSGNIPSEMGQLSNLTTLSLYENLLTGNIPPELGQLSRLRIIRIENNKLSGEISSELINLDNLVENACNYYYGYNDFRWNSLYALNTELIEFLNKKQCGGDWQSFQNDTAPIASFSVSPSNGNEPLTVQFTDTSTSSADIVKWLWKFGDHATSTEQHPSYVYDQQGEYTVRLSIEDSKGNISQAPPYNIVVDDVDPIADFTANPQSGYEYMSVTFSSLATSHDGITLLWDFGDGYTSTENHPLHIYKKQGTYSVSLTVFESDNDTDTAIKQNLISVSVRPPVTVCNYGCEYNLIQSAIDNSSSGTTIQVKPGKYIGQIDFKGKALTIEATGPVNETIIDARHMGSAVQFVNGETNTSVLKGFTIKNGASEKGGGIIIDNASPEITSCHIIKNRAQTSGAGIYMTNNAAPVLKDCNIMNNNVTNDGGGIYCDHSSQLIMEKCIISNNNSMRGGGVYAEQSILDLNEMTIQNNTALQNGGGLMIANSASLTMTNSQISANASMGTGGGISGLSDSKLVIINCLMNGNTAAFDGGAFYLEDTFLKLLNSTLTMNMAKYGRAILADGSTVIITNSILWNNGQEIESFGSTITATFSNIQQDSGVYPGEGNINVNPEFREVDDFRLENNSPCIGIGTTTGAPVEDIQGTSRPDETITIGAYEVNNTKPSAAIHANSQTIYAGNRIQFTDNSISQEGIHAWYWEFGDGTTSTEKNPSHTYAYTGLYDVSLTVVEADEDTSAIEKKAFIEVKGNIPVAIFSATPRSGFEPLTVQFSDQSTSRDSIISGWHWDFGDGTTSSDPNPVHEYQESGQYTVKLTVTNIFGQDTDLHYRYITVKDTSPISDFEASPTIGVWPLTVKFSDKSKTRGNVPIIERKWLFGDGGTAFSANPEHIYAKTGSYTVTLISTSTGGSGTQKKTHYIHVVEGTRNFDVCQSGCDYQSIQEAINDSRDGDTIRVYSGTYHENINFLGKEINVQSYDGREFTIIDGQSQNSVVRFVNGEQNAMLQGFTIQHGQAAFGGGIFVNASSSPTIQDCIIKNNSAQNDGGGLLASSGSHPKIYNCDFQNNTAQNGAGMVCKNLSSPYIDRTRFTNNIASNNGGAIYVYYRSMPKIQNVSIEHNSATNQGGGIYCEGAGVNIKDSSIIRNESLLGAGLAMIDNHSLENRSIIAQSFIKHNSAEQDGGGLFFNQASISMENCVIFGNHALHGHGIFADQSSSDMINCALVRNSYPDGEAIYASNKSSFSLVNTILWNNGNEIVSVSESNVSAEYSDIEGGYPGQGNINADPIFDDIENGDLHIHKNSPCLNKGTSTNAPWYDIDEHRRPIDGTIDIGIDERKENTFVTAAIHADAIYGEEGMIVQFSDRSTSEEGIAKRLWTIDNQTNNSKNPSYKFTQEGTYQVSLYVEQYDGDHDTDYETITVSDSEPSASFYLPKTIKEGYLIEPVIHHRSYDSATYKWTFGDGNSTESVYPRHTYSQEGEYEVTLTVTEFDGDTASASETIQVLDTEPSAKFSILWNNNIEPASVQFSVHSSGYDSRDYYWSFGDGNTSTQRNPSHTYALEGTYNVVLKVVETDDDEDTYTRQYIVYDSQPTASFTADKRSGSEPLTVQFTDTSSSHETIKHWHWDFGDNQTSTEQNPSHIFEEPGKYTVQLTVTDSDGSKSTKKMENYIIVNIVTYRTVCASGCAYTSIQAAINDSRNADTIVVYPGIYQENIDFIGKRVTVKSISGDVNETIIDGSLSGTVVSFTSGETKSAILEGFTIQNGLSDTLSGGIYIQNASPTIRKCKIIDNEGMNGGGFYISQASPDISYCYISNNRSNGSGGGIYCDNNAEPTIRNTSVISNRCYKDGAGLFVDGAFPAITSLTFDDNAAMDNGGGIAATNNAAFHVERTTIINNSASRTGAGTYLSENASLVFTNCLFTDNWCRYNGGGGSVSNARLTLSNCTLIYNMASSGGPIFADTSELSIQNSILWENGSIESYDSTVSVIYSDIEQESGVFPGEGNINADPMFIDINNNFYLQDQSPCIDAGTSNGAPGVDLKGNTRPVLSGYDMGAFENDNTRPQANFEVNETEILVDKRIVFKDLSHSKESIEQYKWDFGDGHTSTDKSPEHRYASPGIYDISLTVYETDNDQSTIIKQGLIHVQGKLPTPEFTGTNLYGYKPLTVQFHDQSQSPDLTITSWKWDFGDGTISNDQHPEHQYTEAGLFNVRLSVTNDAGTKSEKKWNFVNVKDTKPIADFKALQKYGRYPLSVQFMDESRSYSQIAQWSWDFGDGNTSEEQHPTHQYQFIGTFTVTLTVENADGTDSKTINNYITTVDEIKELIVCKSGCEFQNIQDAIEASHDNDSVVVHPGTYNENIDYKGKSITIKSLQGAQETIIDGQSSGSVVTFQMSEGDSSVLQGFTIQNGKASLGGGILVAAASSPGISGCEIINNIATKEGGGIAAINSAKPDIINCSIQNNTADNGAGIACKNGASPYIFQTIIKNNNAGKNAGGMYAYFSSFPTIRAGQISNNISQARGGGIYGNGGTPRLYDTVIAGNQAVNGGGIAWFDALFPVLEQTTIQGNIAESNGGGLYALDTSLINMENCLISNNASQYGGAMFFKDVSSPSIEFSTIAYNSASVNGNGILGEKNISQVEIRNSILWNSDEELLFDTHNAIISHSNMTKLDLSAYPDNNMNQDPLFVSPGNDYQLGPGSPCKNVASSAYLINTDIENTNRPAGRFWDMGAYEAQNISPTANDQSVQTQEDVAVNITLIASDIDNDPIKNYIIGNPSHGTLSGAGPEISYHPFDDYSGNDSFIFKVNDGFDDSDYATVSISIAPVVDEPIISVNDSSGNEDTQIRLQVNTIQSGDRDNSEILSQVTISNVPQGFQLSNATDNGDGSWSTSPEQAKNIDVKPKAYVSGNYTLNISVTASENNQTKTAAKDFQLTVIPVANKPVLNVVDTATGDEDTPISLSIDEPSLVDPDGSEKLSHIRISNMPDGAILSAGTNNNNGTWTLTLAELANLTIQPKQHDASNFTLNVSVDAIEQANNDTATTHKQIAVTVTPVADKPVLSVRENVSGDEDTQIELIIQPELIDQDGSEKITEITINNVPEDASLTNGINNGDGLWTLTESQLNGLKLTPKTHAADDFTLDIVIKSEETENGDFQTDRKSIAVDFIPVADPPHLTVTAYTSGDEDTAIPLIIEAPVLEDLDGSESLSDIHIYGVPENAFLSKGTVVDGCWILKSEELAGLSITPVVHDSNDYTLTIAVTATENENLVTATTNAQILLDIIPVADPPILSVAQFTTGDEDTPIPLTIHKAELVDLDGSEVLSNLTVSNLPADAKLSNGFNTGNGTWIVPHDQLENLTVTPEEHNADNFVLSLCLSSTEKENNDITSVTQSITVTVIPVADVPDLVVVDQAVSHEDVPITLTISPPGLVDRDQSEYLSDITIAGLPYGAILSVGEKDGDDWVVKSEALANLILTPALHDGNDITLTVSVTATEYENNDQATRQEEIAIDIIPVADTPELTVTHSTGNEDTQIPLNILPALVDSDGSEVFSLITISHLPDEAVLSAGTKNTHDWTLQFDQLSNLTVLPKYNDSNDFTVTVHVAAIEQENNDSAGITKTVQVDVIPVADPPNLTLIPMTSGDEDHAVTLTISPPGLVDTDGSEELSDITISQIPDGASLSKGSSLGDGKWQLTADELDSLSITPSLHNADNFILSISVLSTEKENNHQATTQKSITVTVNPVADMPVLTVNDNASGNEDTNIPLFIETPELIDQDGSEKLSNITIDVPNNAIFSAGTNNGDGTWILTFSQLTDLFIKPEPNVGDDFSLTVSVQSEEIENGDFKTAQQIIHVDVIPVADSPILTVQNDISGNEDTEIPLIIHQPELVDLDGSESLGHLIIAGVPDQAILSTGVKNEEHWIVQRNALNNLTITPAQHNSNDILLSVSVSTTESENQSTAKTTQKITLNVIPVADAPMLSVVESAYGDEDTPIPLTIEHPLLVDSDGSEKLANMIISKVPSGATLSDGTYVAGDNPHWSVPLENLNGLTITPFLHDADDFTVEISAISIEEENQNQAVTSQHITISVNPVADMPKLKVGNFAYGNEDTNIAIIIEQTDLIDTDGSEKLEPMIIEGVPDNAILSAGMNNGDGKWVLPISDLSDLFVRLAPNVAQNFNLNLSLMAVETENNDFKTAHQTIAVDVIPVADAPLLVVENTATGNEDTAIALIIHQLIIKDHDGSETLGEITFSGIPDQAILSAGKKMGGDWILTHEELSDLTITPALHDAGDFLITVRATAIETGNLDTEESEDFIFVNVIPVADPPQLSLQNQISGKEKTDIPIHISPPQLIDMDGSEYMSNIFISSSTDNIHFSSGASKGNGIWEFTLEQLNDLAVQLDVDQTSEITLDVSVYATEFENKDTVVSQQNIVINVMNTDISGDVNADAVVDLEDAIIVLYIITEIDHAEINIDADVNNDGQIGMAEVQYILKILARIPQLGDIDGNGAVELKDAMIALEVLTGEQLQGINIHGSRIDLAKVLFILNWVALGK